VAEADTEAAQRAADAVDAAECLALALGRPIKVRWHHGIVLVHPRLWPRVDTELAPCADCNIVRQRRRSGDTPSLPARPPCTLSLAGVLEH
jgi:hypothetical protein